MSKLIVSQSTLARMLGKSRSHICELLQGELAPAKVGRRVDARHPVVLAYAEKVGATIKLGAHAPVAHAGLVITESTVSVVQFAREVGSTPDEVIARIPEAVIPDHLVSATTFAKLAGVSVGQVVQDAQGPLRPAVHESGRLDLNSGAALEYMRRHPFERDKDGEPICPQINGAGFLVPAVIDDEYIDAAHPIAKVFSARCGAKLDEHGQEVV